jgi:hypothetical protein
MYMAAEIGNLPLQVGEFKCMVFHKVHNLHIHVRVSTNIYLINSQNKLTFKCNFCKILETTNGNLP